VKGIKDIPSPAFDKDEILIRKGSVAWKSFSLAPPAKASPL
jgi:hypothetical protein